MTLAHRRVHPPALPAPSVTDVLLSGWSGRRLEDDEADFAVFELTEAALGEAWRSHREALMCEAARRGICKPWAIEQGFDG